VFHVAAKTNSLEALQTLIGGRVFLDELLKKDFKGDTPLHLAVKHGSRPLMAWFLERCTKGFTEIQNDMGLTAAEAGKEKLRFMEEESKQSAVPGANSPTKTMMDNGEDLMSRILQTVRLVDQF